MLLSDGTYQGTRRKLVLSFDVGTTFSGVSYSILDPGFVPKVQGVTRFPGQEHMGKIPTIVYYDKLGQVRAVGAEAIRDEIKVEADENGWVKAEWFKLHLRPRTGGKQSLDGDIPSLPPNKPVVVVLADFLRYLLECTAQFIQESHLNGKEIWAATKDEIYFVLSHPNGWGGREQNLMRGASILAGLISNTPSGKARVSFVTEGEASLHFAIQNDVLSGHMKKSGVIIADAGGGTIDLSAYRKMVGNTEIYEEIAAPESLFCGSVYVNFYSKRFLESYLDDSPFKDDLEEIVNSFDRSTKPRFKTAEGFQYIKFGGIRDNDPAYNIKLGQLKLPGSDVATFFEPSIDCIVQAILSQNRSADETISHVVLVGGFAASDWLFKKVSTALSRSCPRLTVVRPEEHLNKAVAHGAIYFFTNHYVHTRISRATYGILHWREFDKDDPEHQKRRTSGLTLADGTLNIPMAFRSLLKKGEKITEASSFRSGFRLVASQKSNFINPPELHGYSGSLSNPGWWDMDPDNFSAACQIIADMSRIPVSELVNPSGKVYYQADFEVVLSFGLIEMTTQIAWYEKGIEKRSPAAIVYDNEPSDRTSILIKDFQRFTAA